MSIRSIFILVMAAAASWVRAQEMSEEHLRSKMPYFEYIGDDMSCKKSRCILEDSEGYIWIGTTNGVERYDGIGYKAFIRDDNAKDISNYISALCEDKTNNRIYGSYNKKNLIFYIDKRDYSEHFLPNPFTVNDGSTDPFSAMAEYDDSLLLVKCNSGTYLFNKDNGHLKGPFKTDRKSQTVPRQCIEAGDKMVFSRDGRLEVLMERRTDTLITERLDIGREYITRTFDMADDTTVVLAARMSKTNRFELLKYHLNSRRSEVCRELDKYPMWITCAPDGVWMGYANFGLAFYEYSTNELYEYNTRNSTLHDNKVQSMLMLRNQPILLITTNNDGLIKLDYNCSQFMRFDTRRISDSSSCDMFMIFKDTENNYWAWFIDGMFKKSAEDYMFRKHDFESCDCKIAFYKAIEDTTNHKIYFMSLKKIVEYDMKSKRDKTIVEMASTSLNDITISGGKLYFSDKRSIYTYDIKSQKRDEIELPQEMIGNITATHIEGDSLIWIGNNISQVFAYNINTKELKFHATAGQANESIRHIRSKSTDGERELWIAADRNGLFCYLPEKRHLTQIINSKLLSDRIINMEIDNKGNIWTSTVDGLTCQNAEDKAVYEYGDKAFGLNFDYRTQAQYKSASGDILFGGTNYFVEFNSTSFAVRNTYYPAPVVSSYRLINAITFNYDSYTKEETYAIKDTIEIPEGIRSIQLTLRQLNYSQSKDNIVQWRMPDVSEEWETVKTETPIICSNLRRGINKVELRSCEHNGTPVSDIRTVYLKKHVYFYEHPLFHVLMATIAVVGIIGIILLKSRIDEARRKELEKEVKRQAGEIKETNEQLLMSQARIEQQNAELRNHRNILEKEVEERTADLVAARQKAEENSKLKSAFLANLSHEVRTPMNCIVGFSKLLADPSCTREEQVEFVHLIQESSNSMLVLIGDLLDVSRIESGQLRVNFGDFDLCTELDDVYHLLFMERKKANVDFELHVDDDLNGIVIHSDKDRFRQIIINITYNAFKFTERGHVHIHADKKTGDYLPTVQYPDTLPAVDGDILLVRIEDTGIGIPADKTEVIFEPFRKLNNNKTLYPGLGLGLNIVKNLVRLLHGQIWVTSVEGQGTTFYFYLPLNNNE